jgi:4-hydroxy-tetrahydrodipicolinate reductase
VKWPRSWNVEAYVRQERVRTIHYGIGAIGTEVVRLALNRPDIEIVGAIDAHPGKAGKDLGEVVEAGRNLGITVSYDPEPILSDVYADVVLHATASNLTAVYQQILQMVAAEKSVISSSEELAFPWVRYPEIVRKLERRARETGVRILGTGVNPGFVMDTLPLVLATACQEVRSIRVTRVVDVAQRRPQLQAKVGVGLSPQAFQREANEGSVGHVGLRESLFMVVNTLGWRLDDIAESMEPVLTKERVKTESTLVEKGYVSGLRQTVRALVAGREVVQLELEMSLGAPDPRDEVVMEGKPPLHLSIPGGIQGDMATAAIMVNCVPAITRSRAVGLLSMRDMPLVPYLRPRPEPKEELAD